MPSTVNSEHIDSRMPVYLVHEDYVNTFVTHEQPVMWMSLMSFLTLLSGVIVYLIDRRMTQKQNIQ